MVLAPPQPGDFCCIPVGGVLGMGIEAGQFVAEKLQRQPARLLPYDHAEVYVGMPDLAGPHGYTYSAYPDNLRPLKSGKRALPCPPEQLPGSIWSSGIIEMTPAAREGVVNWCLAHPRVPYSWADYAAIGLHAAGMNTEALRTHIANLASMICSWYTDAAMWYGGNVHLFDDGRWPGYVTPGDLAGLLLTKAGRR